LSFITTSRLQPAEIALRYTNAIVGYCESLDTFPLRGNGGDNIRLGLGITHYKKRTVITFDVDAERVSIIGAFFAGASYGEVRLKLSASIQT